jgi:glycosyltransferase involved in cell wall biosynthesis
MKKEINISIVSPVYKAKNIIPVLVQELHSVLQKITLNYEIILVDDGCPSDSWATIDTECQKDNRVKGLRLSKNFGQHYAISAGLDYASGEWVVVMDCDLQDHPLEIIKLYETTKVGYDIVLGRRVERRDNFLKKKFSKLFYLILSYLSDQKIDSTIANFGIYNYRVIEEITKLNEKNRFFPSMVQWVGFNKTAITIEHYNREEGNSSYDFKKLVKLGLDVILSNSEKPIRLIVRFGLFVCLMSFFFILYQLYNYLSGKTSVLGYTSIIIAICFFSGLIISFLGILGLYLGKVFEGVKNRPIFIVSKKINF